MLGPPSTQSSIKLGAWIHTGNFRSHDKGNYEKDFGLYLILDRPLASLGKGTLFGWVKSGVAPRDCNRIRHFQGGGLTYQDPFGASSEDNISLAVASAFFCKEYRDDLLLTNHETAIELSLRKQWNLLTVQPDIQYILNPGGVDHLNNPLCLILRIQLSL
jgi:carbohydrate-selective porin OprB